MLFFFFFLFQNSSSNSKRSNLKVPCEPVRAEGRAVDCGLCLLFPLSALKFLTTKQRGGFDYLGIRRAQGRNRS